MRRKEIKEGMRVRHVTKAGRDHLATVLSPRARNIFMDATEPDRVLVKMDDGRDRYIKTRDVKPLRRAT